MNIEEAKANIGKEVVLDESTKPYGNCESYFPDSDNKKLQSIPVFLINDVDYYGDVSLKYIDERGEDRHWGYIHPRHLKLKEQDMNYKIRVTPETSKEVQELFFELGFEWRFNGRDIMDYTKDLPNIFLFDGCLYNYISKEKRSKLEEITLPQLRDMVVLKRNDVSDTTHVDNEANYYVGCKVYYWSPLGNWEVSTCFTFSDVSSRLTPINLQPKPQLRGLVHGEEVDYIYHVGKDVTYKGGDACLVTVDNNDFVGIFTQDKRFLKVKSSEISLKPREHECYKIRVDETTKHEAINLLNKIREDRGFYKEAPKSEDDDTKLYLYNKSILSGKSGKPFDEEYFDKFDGKEVALSELYNIAHGNKQMTWQDAEQAIKEGKDVQVFICEWIDISDVFKNHKFRLKPKTVTLEARQYTKEELLKIAGEME